MSYQLRTGARCTCRPGAARDNCPACEGTGWMIDFARIRARTLGREAVPRTAHDCLPGTASGLLATPGKSAR